MSDGLVVGSLGAGGFDEIIFGHRGPSSLPMDSVATRQNTIGAQDEAPLTIQPQTFEVGRVFVRVRSSYCVFSFVSYSSSFGTDVSLFPLTKKPSKATALVCFGSHLS